MSKDMLFDLKMYLENTPKFQLKKDFEALKEFNKFGPEMLKILENSKNESKYKEIKRKSNDSNI